MFVREVMSVRPVDIDRKRAQVVRAGHLLLQFWRATLILTEIPQLACWTCSPRRKIHGRISNSSTLSHTVIATLCLITRRLNYISGTHCKAQSPDSIGFHIAGIAWEFSAACGTF